LKLVFKENLAMSKPLGEKIFDAVFSSLNCVDWHIDSWSGGWGVERCDQGILVGIKRDDMTYIMGQFPNVKVMGFTSSNSSCQATTGIDFGAGGISFSAVPNLLENGEIAIDTYTDHIGRTPFDEKIPFDETAITTIFDNGEDYLLDYVTNSF
jgi:hypothetical protein